MLKFQSTKVFLLKVIHLIGLKKFLLLIKYKIQFQTYLINDLNGEEIKDSFYEKELQKTNQKEFRIEKVIEKKGDKLYVKWKGFNNSFNSWIDKKGIVMSYVPTHSEVEEEIVSVTLNLSNYVTHKNF